MTATVAIVGRPNVGKSTLFNRLVGKRLAIVEPTPGVTRDWQEGAAHLGGLEFRLLDTPGLEEAAAGTVEAAMRRQAESALSQADLALLVFDARAGITPLDRHFAGLLRESGIPVIIIANKCESSVGQQGAMEGFALGLGDPVMMSAEHGIGLEGLREALVEAFGAIEETLAEETAPTADQDLLYSDEDEEIPGGPLRLAVVGRPNVGKSTLINGLIGSERMVTGPEPGITRDAIPVDWEWKGRPVRLVDTAGLRRRANVTEKLERMSVVETERAIRLAEVVVLVLDATVMAERQDLAIARQVVEEGRALVIAANKWDLVDDPQAALNRLRDRLETSLPQIKGVATVTISALTGRNLDRLLATVFAAYDTWNQRVPTGELNRWLEELVARHPPPAVSGRRLRLRYITQAKARPPTFILFVSRPGEIPASYLRYLENGLREAFDLPGVPLRLIPRGGKNPYVAAGRG
jgi:GTP-binding protein